MSENTENSKKDNKEKTDAVAKAKEKKQSESVKQDHANSDSCKNVNIENSNNGFFFTKLFVFLTFICVLFLTYNQYNDSKKPKDNKPQRQYIKLQKIEKKLEDLNSNLAEFSTKQINNSTDQGSAKSFFDFSAIEEKIDDLTSTISQDSNSLEEISSNNSQYKKTLDQVHTDLEDIYEAIQLERDLYNDVMDSFLELSEKLNIAKLNEKEQNSQSQDNPQDDYKAKITSMLGNFVKVTKLDQGQSDNFDVYDLIAAFEESQAREVNLILDKVVAENPELQDYVDQIKNKVNKYFDEYNDFDLTEKLEKIIYLIETQD
jgi:uncharacterized coiled-coil protein SlyX